MTSATPVSFYNSKIEYSTNGSAWNDASGYSNQVTVQGGDRAIGKFFDFADDVPQLTAGKRDSLQVGLKVAFSATASDVLDAFETAYETAPSTMYLRWTPGSSASGQKQYTTGKGIVKSFAYPQGNAQSGDPIVLDVVVEVPSISKGTS